MTADSVSALDAEIAALTKELESHPAWAKREAALKLRTLYAQPSSSSTLKPNTSKSEKRPAAALSRKARMAIKAQVLDVVDKYFGDSSGPYKTGYLYKVVTNAGLTVPGKDPRNNLSAMLSNSDKLESTPDRWVRAGDASAPEVAGAADAPTSAAPKSGGETPANRAHSRAFIFAEGG